MLHIAFDAKRIFHNFTGLGNYSRELVGNLQKFFPDHHYHLFSPKLKENQRTNAFLDPQTYHLHTATQWPSSLWRSFGIKKDLQKADIQLFHGLSHEIPVNIHKSGIKSVVSIHDLIFRKYPEQYSFIDRNIYDRKFRYACEKSDRIIAISESTKQDIIRYYQIPSEKIEVIYQTCHEQFFSLCSEEYKKIINKKYDLPSDYLLYVGSIIPRKRLLSIVKALRLTSNDIPLVVLGDGKVYKEQILAYIKNHDLESRVFFPQNVNFSDFPAIYQQASAFIYPSIYEGFGIPIIEAAYSHIPIITTQYSSLREAAGPDALYIHPDKPEEIAHAIDKLLTDSNLSVKLTQDTYAYVQRFSSKDITHQLMALYHQTLGLPFAKGN